MYAAAVNFPLNKPPVRIYVAHSAIDYLRHERISSSDVDFKPDVFETSGVQDFLEDIFKKHEELGPYTFVLGSFGAHPDGIPFVDFFGYYQVGDWPGAAVAMPLKWTLQGMKRSMVQIPEDTLLMLGKEAEYRKTTKSINEYITNMPQVLALSETIDWSKNVWRMHQMNP
ncbi:hypothetical protein C4573_02295 [Candidatus Woesearchaeota archaeon]|nr:MAG: hypothetical protein C4573_02295 [Candidatus Woesearchaeota archaeon]